MNNAIELIKRDLKRHQAPVVLPGEKTDEAQTLYLVLITAKTSKHEDFLRTYSKQVTATHRKIAEKVFGQEETDNIYGVFLDGDLRPIFAFNRDFGIYDRKKRAVVFKDVDEVLLEKIPRGAEGRAAVELEPPSDSGRSRRNRSGFPGMLLKYSLVEKKKP